MTTQFVVDLARETIFTALWVVGPLMAVGFVVGMIVSVVQAVMQLQEVTLGFVPKIVALGAALIAFAHWMLDQLMRYTQLLLGGFDRLL
ncbi:MAG: flagellar biosynthetic protein FliQ [Deltaproteobacteria bacterium]|nr:flagellar biosynthetic protein FliQ [Deltaproteobacteria bacterium]